MNVLEELEKLRRRHRFVDDDCWYSCPMAEDYCGNEEPGSYCNCGADDHNARVDAIIQYLKENLKDNSDVSQ